MMLLKMNGEERETKNCEKKRTLHEEEGEQEDEECCRPVLARIASSPVDEVIAAARRLFKRLDVNGDGNLSRDEFTDGLLSLKEIDISKTECNRLFSSIDSMGTGYVSSNQFVQELQSYRWLQSLVSLHDKSSKCRFEVKQDYDFSKSTNENYAFKASENLPDDKIQEFFGEFADIRSTRDYSYHTNYTKNRQLWQDRVVKSCLGKTEPQARPWVVYSCGPMGVGKGHVLSWLSSQGLFPLEFVVHIDPDFFKRVMPEWDTYIRYGEEEAGTKCHMESAFLQEIAQEVAMRQRQNVWVDGSLSDGDWFSTVFKDVRKRYPHYRIAIMHITACEQTIRERIARRARATGRIIPESQIQRSLQNPEKSIEMLGPLSDLVVRIVNETNIVLKCVEDRSGNWRGGLERHFGCMSYQPRVFPASLGPLYMEKTSFVGHPFIAIEAGGGSNGKSLEKFMLCQSEACIASPYLRLFLNVANEHFHYNDQDLCMTPMFPIVHNHDVREQAGVPERASFYRFIFPSTIFRTVRNSIFQSTQQASIDWSDPDILILLSGGFVYYDSDGIVVEALALSTEPSKYFFHYHNPMQLNERDANRLHSLNRWKAITKADLREKGAKYFTYIFPNEQLETIKFGEYGSFAYLFREPSDPPSSMDRYFTPVLKY